MQKPLACKREVEWVDGLVTEECPVLWLQELAHIARAYLFSEKGILPHTGGWADQPGVLMQLVERFSSEVKRV